MAVIVKNMSMPTSCWECRFFVNKEKDIDDQKFYTGTCLAIEREDRDLDGSLFFLFTHPRPRWCPLVTVNVDFLEERGNHGALRKFAYA